MPEAEAKETMSTNLALPVGLRDRILQRAAGNRRGLKGEILVLLEEALSSHEAIEARAKRK